MLTIKTTELPPIPLLPLLTTTAVAKRHSDLRNGSLEIPPAGVHDSLSTKSSDKDANDTHASITSTFSSKEHSPHIRESVFLFPTDGLIAAMVVPEATNEANRVPWHARAMRTIHQFPNSFSNSAP